MVWGHSSSPEDYRLCLPVKSTEYYSVGTILPLEVAAKSDWLEYKCCSKVKSLSLGIDFAKAKDAISQFQKGYIIPDGVTEIEGWAFEDCTSLTSVVIPGSVTEIGESAFAGCTNLISVVIPEGITTIYHDTFYFCKNLVSVVVPDSVTEIVEGSFLECTSLNSIEIPKNCKFNRSYVFPETTKIITR